MNDWIETKHDCKPFSAAVESPDAKETHILLAIISIGMVRDCVSRDHATQWSVIEGENRGPKTDPRGALEDRSDMEDSHLA